MTGVRVTLRPAEEACMAGEAERSAGEARPSDASEGDGRGEGVTTTGLRLLTLSDPL